MNSIGRLLIANRGEIACRVARTARMLGMQTIAVHSDADRDALHVRAADQAIHIGPAPVAESYLSIDRILDAAKRTNADAIHPGYGFLSENAAFARACAEAGLVFVGPSAEAIDLMGDKARAKRAMIEAGVPCIPGYQGEDQHNETLLKQAQKIGFPIMIKAAAGGGGRGMRLVHESRHMQSALEAARSEAIGAFGSGSLILEKAVLRPRHVEVQIFGDCEGNLVYLGERDCSVQRRHQKVIEEAPCPVMTPALREAMGEAAVAAARAVSYLGAGTVEFLLSQEGSFYFLEMNTRLQVEHPVTEAITGLDLVELQLRVAAGEPLGFNQADVELAGHAIEARLYAEDPRSDFMPSTGTIHCWQAPTGTGVRVDGGVETGSEVSPFYDPMLAKVIASGSTREEARRRLVQSLSQSLLVGPATNRDFLIDALKRDTFVQGEATTAFIDEEYGNRGFDITPTLDDLGMAAALQYALRSRRAVSESLGVNPELLNWSSNVRLEGVSVFKIEGESKTFSVHPQASDHYLVCVQDEYQSEFKLLELDAQRATIERGNERRSIVYFSREDGREIFIATQFIEFSVEDVASGTIQDEATGSGRVLSPMHGQVLEVLVQEGDEVVRGQRLAVIEAMKMQHKILAGVDGRVKCVHAEANAQIEMDGLMIEIDAQESA